MNEDEVILLEDEPEEPIQLLEDEEGVEEMGQENDQFYKGDSAFESYVKTTTDDPVLTEAEWVASLVGQPGATPVISENGNWWINGVDTGVKAQGEDGAPGVGIVSIVKTDTQELTDTYTITFSNNTTFDFYVVNGTNGDDANVTKTNVENALSITEDEAPEDEDEVLTLRAGGWLKTSWLNIKAFFKAYFDTIYATIASVLGKKSYHGVESIGAVSFDNSTHIVTLASIKYWFKGASFTGANVTCDLDAYISLAEGDTYFVYFDAAAGVLKASESFFDLHEQVPILLVWWNGTAGALQKEWHGYRRDIDWHINAHLTIGARYYNGLSLAAPTTANDAALSILSGIIFDEDLMLSIDPQTVCRIVYKNASGKYTWAESSLPYAGTAGAPVYLDTDTMTLTAANSAKYLNMWAYATNDLTRPIYIIPTHAATDYNTVALARNETPPALGGLTLTPEMKLIFKFIYKGDGNFQEAADYRNSSSLPAGGTASTTAGNVSVIPVGGIAATNVQSALEELDTEKQNSLIAFTQTVQLTQAEYTALSPKVSTTLYLIIG